MKHPANTPMNRLDDINNNEFTSVMQAMNYIDNNKLAPVMNISNPTDRVIIREKLVYIVIYLSLIHI